MNPLSGFFSWELTNGEMSMSGLYPEQNIQNTICDMGASAARTEVKNDFPDSYLQEPIFVSARRGGLKYLSDPLSEDLEVTGNVVVYLYAAIRSRMILTSE